MTSAMYARRPTLWKRIDALEKLLQPEKLSASRPDPKGDDEIMRLARLRISGEDGAICDRLGRREEPCLDWTERESEAVDAYIAAITIECKRAGHRSIDEFQASYCGEQ